MVLMLQPPLSLSGPQGAAFEVSLQAQFPFLPATEQPMHSFGLVAKKQNVGWSVSTLLCQYPAH